MSLIGYAGYQEFRYFPSVVELLVTVGLIALAILTFALAARHLPVYGGSHAVGRQPAPERVTVS